MTANENYEEALARAIEDRGKGEEGQLPVLFTINELAKYLQVSNTTIYRLIEDGALVGIRIGRSLRFTRKNIEDMLEFCAEDNS